MDAPAPTLYSLTLREKRWEHGDIWSLRVAPQLPVDFRPGQYVHLKVLDPQVEKSVRHMSLASAPADPLLQFTMHMRADSPFKRSLLALEPGGAAALFKVKGEFTLPDDPARPVVLLASGVGITPYRAMLRQLAAEGRRRPLTLIHVDRGPHLFADELAALPGRRQLCGRAGFDGLLQQAVRAEPQALWYAAGSTSFVQAVHARLQQLGIAADAIRLDDFKAYDELEEPVAAEAAQG